MTSVVEKIATLAIGRVEVVTAAELRIGLFDETPQATALNTGVPTGFPRINAYVTVPNESGAVVAVLKEISVVRSKQFERDRQDQALVDLPFPARTIVAIPFATLVLEGEDENHQPLYALERGVPVLPSVGDPVLLPTAAQLRSIVEAQTDDRIVQIGTAPFAANARVWVHPDKLFGRHLAILGNTGSGKSCSVAGIIRWSLESVRQQLPKNGGPRAPNTRFIILDPNGEYAEAFKDGTLPVRRYSVDGADGARPLVVPGWLWNGQEWSAYTQASGGVQRPTLLQAIRLLRNAGSTAETARTQVIRRYHAYYRQVETLYADVPQSISGLRARDVGGLLEGLLGLTQTHENRLASFGDETSDLVDAIVALLQPIEQVRQSRHWTSQNSSGYNSFQPNDLITVLSALRGVTQVFPLTAAHGEISEDAPVRFDVSSLADRIQEVAMATGGQAVANVEPLINRIQVMLGDTQLRPIIDATEVNSLTDWLNELLGPIGQNSESLCILDLSLVPSDVVHIAIAVISRLIFEALQRHLKQHGEALPTVLVLEEAYTFVRKDAETGASAAASDLCRQTFERISREGRKSGLGLVLSSQRPSELSPTVLAQCNSFLLHRIVNDVDQNLVRRLVPDALGGLLGELPTLPSQQAILLGWAVPTPVLVRIRDLEHRPRSDDPAFWETWRYSKGRPPDWPTIVTSWEQTIEEPADESDAALAEDPPPE